MDFEFDLPPEVLTPTESLTSYEDGVIHEFLGRTELTQETSEQSEVLLGDPEDAAHWHPQTEQYSCAVACQEFVAEQLLDREFSEQELIDLTQKEGWYDPEQGTSASDVGKALEALGLQVERSECQSIRSLMQSLANGEKVMCGVNNAVLADPRCADLPGIKANHMVQVIGIDLQDPARPQVLLNDPGVSGGGGIRHDLDVFVKAWDTGNRYMVTAERSQ